MLRYTSTILVTCLPCYISFSPNVYKTCHWMMQVGRQEVAILSIYTSKNMIYKMFYTLLDQHTTFFCPGGRAHTSPFTVTTVSNWTSPICRLISGRWKRSRTCVKVSSNRFILVNIMFVHNFELPGNIYKFLIWQ